MPAITADDRLHTIWPCAYQCAGDYLCCIRALWCIIALSRVAQSVEQSNGAIRRMHPQPWRRFESCRVIPNTPAKPLNNAQIVRVFCYNALSTHSRSKYMTELQQARLIKQAHALLDELELIIHAMFEAADGVGIA